MTCFVFVLDRSSSFCYTPASALSLTENHSLCLCFWSTLLFPKAYFSLISSGLPTLLIPSWLPNSTRWVEKLMCVLNHYYKPPGFLLIFRLGFTIWHQMFDVTCSSCLCSLMWSGVSAVDGLKSPYVLEFGVPPSWLC